MGHRYCRDCLLVKVDIYSGDIDGCLRDDLLEELLRNIPKPLKERIIEKLTCEENDVGFIPFKEDFEPKNPEEFRKWAEIFDKAREKAYNETKTKLRLSIKKELKQEVGLNDVLS
jgi:hypothetical protein